MIISIASPELCVTINPEVGGTIGTTGTTRCSFSNGLRIMTSSLPKRLCSMMTSPVMRAWRSAVQSATPDVRLHDPDFAAQIPQGDVDGGDRVNHNAPPAIVAGEIVHAVPEPFDVRRIGANNNLI